MSLLETADSACACEIAEGLTTVFPDPTPLPCSSNWPMFRYIGSSFSSGKKSDVSESVALLGSNQRIQSSKVPKLKAWSHLMSGFSPSFGSVQELSE